MYSGLFLLITAASGGTYAYCLLRTHFLAVKFDKCGGLSRSKSGEIRVSDLKNVKADDAGIALCYLRLSNVIAIGYLTAILLLVLFESAGSLFYFSK